MCRGRSRNSISQTEGLPQPLAGLSSRKPHMSVQSLPCLQKVLRSKDRGWQQVGHRFILYFRGSHLGAATAGFVEPASCRWGSAGAKNVPSGPGR